MVDYDLERFVDAQRDTYDRALGEIARGRKQGHWMWFVFPQLAGLGHSAMSERYAIRSVDEARAYLAHPILGRRLLECVGALQDLPMSDPDAVFGAVDTRKLHSSMTLFCEAHPAQPLLTAALNRWFNGVKDKRTLELIGRTE